MWNAASDALSPGATLGYWTRPVANGGSITVTAHGLNPVTGPSMLEVIGTSIRAAGDNVSFVDFTARNNGDIVTSNVPTLLTLGLLSDATFTLF